MIQATIYFENNIQAALYKNELVGQISDGMWENSTPHNHWQAPCRATVAVDTENPRVENAWFRRRYNFANKTLVDVVGDRMLNIAMLAKAGYSDDIIRQFDEVYDSMFTDANEYWAKKRALFIETFGSKDGYDQVVNTDRMQIKELKKILKRMSEIVNKACI
jgi:hypothetical protein